MEPKKFLAWMRTSKLRMYAVTGTFGGAAGAVVGELFLGGGASDDANWGALVASTGLWMAGVAGVLAAALFVGGGWYQRHELRPRRVGRVWALGALAGFVSGAVAQVVYSVEFGSEEFKNLVVRTLVWALMGALLGALLSRSVPNLGFTRGAGAGLVGGALGCVGFLLVCSVVPDILGRLVGMATLGCFLGVAMYAAEDLFREASVEVMWAPYETTTVGLGAQAVTVGGGEDHIFVRGLPPHVSSIVLRNGQIEHVETASGKRTPLQDGSRLRVGGLNLVIHAAR